MGAVAALRADVQFGVPRAYPHLPDLYAPTGPPPRQQYATLDGLRGVAAISVAILHAGSVLGGIPLPNAHLAVDFFLQLSGFIVAYAYGPRILAGMRIGDFARRRIGRLYPAFLLGLALGIIAAILLNWYGPTGIWTVGQFWCNVAMHAVMLPQACGAGVVLFPLNGPMWSIFFEVVFSFMFFLGAAYLLRRWVAVTAAVAVFLVVAIVFLSSFDVGSRGDGVSAAFVRLGFSFLIGVAAYTLRFTARRPSNLIVTLLPFLLFAVLMFPQQSMLYELWMVGAVFPAMILVGALYDPESDRLRWVLLQLGVLSYMLYAIHVPLFEIAGLILQDAGLWLGVVTVAAVTVLAWVLARTYEPWARALFERLTTRRAVNDEKAPRRTLAWRMRPRARETRVQDSFGVQ